MDKVFAVVSAYKPTTDLLENCRNMFSQFFAVVVVDDGSGTEYGEVLAKCEQIGCVVIKNVENLGIAAALNSGIKYACKNGADFVMTLDQDTKLPKKYVPTILSTFHAAQKQQLPIAFVSPMFTGGEVYRVEQKISNFSFLSETMQSGMLIPVETFTKIGLLDEQLFIDAVDTEYFLRAKSFGLKNLACPDLNSNHSWGKPLLAYLFGKPILRKGKPLVFRENPMFRYYYIFRNHRIMYKKYFLGQPAWFVNYIKDELIIIAIMVLFSKNRKKFLQMFFWGNVHGLLGKTGKIPESIAKKL